MPPTHTPREKYAPGVFYALLVRIEGDVHGDAEVYLDAIDASQADPWLRQGDEAGFRRSAPHTGVVVHFAGSQGDVLDVAGDRQAPLSAGSWYRLTLGNHGYPADWVENDNLVDDGQHTFIVELSEAGVTEGDTLTRFHQIQGQAPGSGTGPGGGVALDWWVACMNMGQGSCVAVMSPNTNRPVAYIDVGFPTMPYARTAPENAIYKAHYLKTNTAAAYGILALKEQRDPRCCICDDPLFLLTHWDWDHWYQADLIRQRGAVTVDVLAPQMPTTGSTAAKFWNALPPLQQHVFPAKGWVAFDWGFAVRCSGPKSNKNECGVAALVRVKAGVATLAGYPKTGTDLLGALPAFHPDEYYVLVPGDASYANVPFGATHPQLVGLIATHHGADHRGPLPKHFTVPGVPTPALVGTNTPVVYSYGLADAAIVGQSYCYRARRPRVLGTGHAMYGHPRPAATSDYQAAGRNRRLDTAAVKSPLGPTPAATGHICISYPWMSSAKRTGCTGLGCYTAMDQCQP